MEGDDLILISLVNYKVAKMFFDVADSDIDSRLHAICARNGVCVWNGNGMVYNIK